MQGRGIRAIMKAIPASKMGEREPRDTRSNARQSVKMDPLPFLLDSEVDAIQSICLSSDNFLEKGGGAAGVRLSLAEAWPLTDPEGP